MPLSSINKSSLSEQQKIDDPTNHKKRKAPPDSSNSKQSPTSYHNKKHKHDPHSPQDQNQIIDMAESQRKANFSALTSPNNGFNRHSPIMNSKPGAAKKLVIKNFKGKPHYISEAYQVATVSVNCIHQITGIGRRHVSAAHDKCHYFIPSFI